MTASSGVNQFRRFVSSLGTSGETSAARMRQYTTSFGEPAAT